MADRRDDISGFFTNAAKMTPPIQRVNVDFALPMLEELDHEARQLNVSRQAVIKTLLRHALARSATAGAAA
jgi:metal-responsive CopG/Arc/MetJ family transcriptional regulator